jgi:D-methionine transport system permease protein
MNWSTLLPDLWLATQDTLYMVGISTILTVLIGLPLGILLILTEKNGLTPLPWLNQILGIIVNIGRSLPFVILLIAILPFTRFLIGTTIGTDAAIVPLTVAAVPFFARLAEGALREVDRGVIEAARAMGSTVWQIIIKVFLPECLPALVTGITITIISLLSYSAVAGTIGAGGLGNLAITHGYYRFETDVMITTVVLLIVLVQGIQWLGNWIVRILSARR